ncbi:hypothetical protein [Mucilaginibacter auburnensis]|uniref:Uncharacterized protein n=1 Tax=Mucilaginibacter auburnensis TaxID=1457233 RepID=A0A2H9VL48_9SPHI|nr:hypothetical protein [Mucilaginibacter auburnensis]PJJ79071.1 hypothetical protein CLV57_2195 [Mucilaginibacter auburnensis]
MRVNPDDDVVRGTEVKAAYQKKVDRITRIVALVVAFLSTYFFIIKILFL